LKWKPPDPNAGVIALRVRRKCHRRKQAVKSRRGQTGDRDIRRAFMLRDTVGPDALVMLDANQQ